MSCKLLLYLFTWFTLNTVFHLEQYFLFYWTDSFKCSFHVSNLIQKFQTDLVKSSTQYSLIIQCSCSIYYPVICHPSFTCIMSQLSSLTMTYFILGYKSFSPTFLVSLSDNFRRPPSHLSILWIFQFSPFLTKCTHLSVWLVCLISLTFLAINIENLLYNIGRGYSSGTISGSLFRNSWINILKCANSIPAVYALLYSLYAIDWSTGPLTCLPWSIGPPC